MSSVYRNVLQWCKLTVWKLKRFNLATVKHQRFTQTSIQANFLQSWTFAFCTLKLSPSRYIWYPLRPCLRVVCSCSDATDGKELLSLAWWVRQSSSDFPAWLSSPLQLSVFWANHLLTNPERQLTLEEWDLLSPSTSCVCLWHLCFLLLSFPWRVPLPFLVSQPLSRSEWSCLGKVLEKNSDRLTICPSRDSRGEINISKTAQTHVQLTAAIRIPLGSRFDARNRKRVYNKLGQIVSLIY